MEVSKITYLLPVSHIVHIHFIRFHLCVATRTHHAAGSITILMNVVYIVRRLRLAAVGLRRALDRPFDPSSNLQHVLKALALGIQWRLRVAPLTLRLAPDGVHQTVGIVDPLGVMSISSTRSTPSRSSPSAGSRVQDGERAT